VYCVPQGPSPLVAEPAPARADGDPDAPVGVITIGRLDVYTKGLDLLLPAFASAAAAAPPLGTLALVGPDWNGGRAELERSTRELGLDDRVRFPGRVDGNEVAELLAAADVYVQSSRHEGFSLAVAEALLAGKPVIMTREVGAGSFDEIASLPHVRLVDARADDLGRALVAFAGDLPRLREAAEAARPAVAEFLSWPRIARVHLDAYAEALASS
jgi:glycosyltransferase involved in cell wall biosynthesis